jgi:hypothetical protein
MARAPSLSHATSHAAMSGPYVRFLRRPGGQVGGAVVGESFALHQDSLGHADDVAGVRDMPQPRA